MLCYMPGGSSGARLCGVGVFLSAIRLKGRVQPWLRVLVDGGLVAEQARIAEQSTEPTLA